MHNKNFKKTTILLAVSVISLISLIGCEKERTPNESSSNSSIINQSNTNANNSNISTTSSKSFYNHDDMFSSRDLKQESDSTNVTNYEVKDNEDIHITTEGVYVIKGSASNATIYVEANDTEKVQIVLDELNIENQDMPCIYVKTADKVFVTTTNTSNSLKVTATFKADGDTNLDGTIFSRSDITFNGLGSLEISSTDKGIVGKDDIIITGGTYSISSTSSAIRANDSIRIANGTINISNSTDGLHAENDSDDVKGYIFIENGTLNINVKDDAIHGNSVVQINGGNMTLTGAEGIEGTYIQINGGTITINAKDDGINAAKKSNSYTPTFELNDGNITINMSAGDTDGVDSNGNIIINGGTINVTGSSTFDYDGTASFNGGTIIINGTQVDTIPNQMMGGGMMGGKGNRQERMQGFEERRMY